MCELGLFKVLILFYLMLQACTSMCRQYCVYCRGLDMFRVLEEVPPITSLTLLQYGNGICLNAKFTLYRAEDVVMA